MGLGLHLIGKPPAGGGDALAAAEAWARTHLAGTLLRASRGSSSEGRPTLFVSLHPAAEDLEIFLDDRSRVVLSAKTSNAGPGYHIHLCEAARRMGADLGISWEPPDEEEGTGDETGYFETGDRERLEEEMRRNIAAVVRYFGSPPSPCRARRAARGGPRPCSGRRRSSPGPTRSSSTGARAGWGGRGSGPTRRKGSAS